jgi:exodeoxyribonuclease V beta subunit
MLSDDVKQKRKDRENKLNEVIAYYPYPTTLDEIPLGSHAVIEASAGTGKTYTIEHLVVDRLLKTTARLEHLLVVTFTDKATNELRKRIRDLIERILKATEHTDIDNVSDSKEEPPANHWPITINAQRKLERALFSFERASIYTIHAFCRKILVELAFDSGQLFEQELVDGRRAFREAWRRSLRQRLTNLPDLRHALTTWLDQRESLKSLERLLYDAYSLGYLDLNRPLNHEMISITQKLLGIWDFTLIQTAFEESAIISKALPLALNTLTQIDLLIKEDMGVEDKRQRMIEFDLKSILQPHRSSSKKKKRFPEQLPSKVKQMLECLSQLKILHEIEEAPERQVVESLLPEVNRDLTQMKRRAGQVDYDDLMRCVWRALCSPQGASLAQTLRDRFRFALIDEFQDTDPLQWKIFRRVFVDGKSPNHSLYIIGDPKQAIYTFRGADVHTYIQARYELIRTGAARVPLQMNYRSSPRLIDALNVILDQEGDAALFQGPIKYSEPVKSGIQNLKLTDHTGRERPPITLWRFKPAPPSSRSRVNLNVTELKRAYSRQLANRIHELIHDEAQQLWIEKENEKRQLNPNDILILVRENREALEVANALREVEVPFALYKPEGLLQGTEAREVYYLLQALVDPHDRGARLRAFTTPFFGVSWQTVYHYSTLPPGDAKLERLLQWHHLALEGQYCELFYQLTHQSGLSERELFFAESERELTNYLHIFEILLGITSRDPMTPAELTQQMGRMLTGIESPPGSEDNIQRLYSDRQMVQVMTIHKSKGLEAPIIILYGGFGRPLERRVNVIQDPEEGRRILVGAAARNAVSQRLQLEQRQEDQRLLYVALTRPQVKLILPLIDSSRSLLGSYQPLKERLVALFKNHEKVEKWAQLFEVIDVDQDLKTTFTTAGSSLTQWKPPNPLLEIPDQRVEMSEIRRRHRPLLMTSYTRMKEQGNHVLYTALEGSSAFNDEVSYDPSSAEVTAPNEEVASLPGGRHMGRCLHEIIEEVPFHLFPSDQPSKKRSHSQDSLALPQHFDEWAIYPVIVNIFESVMRRHGIDHIWISLCQRLIYSMLNCEISTPNLSNAPPSLPPLCRTRHIIEMEFIFPIPERAHPSLTETKRALAKMPRGERASHLTAQERLPWQVERGFVKGFIDFIFEDQGLIYFADWKSDQLLTYIGSDFKTYVEDHYLLQAQLYTLGIVRWLKLTDEHQYNQKFGGLYYFFLRAFAQPNISGKGVYFSRPSWQEVCEYEHQLNLTLHVNQ